MDALDTGSGRMRNVLCLSLLAAGLFFAVMADARVYWRWGGAHQQALSEEHTGWTLAHEQNLALNGQPVHLQGFGARGTNRQILDQLKRLYEEREAVVATFSDFEMGWGLAVWPDRRTTFLVMTHRAFPQPLVFLNHTTTASASSETSTLQGIPDYPVGRPGSTIWQAERGMGVRFIFTRDKADAIRTWYDQTLGAQGWAPFFDGGRANTRGPLAVYERDTDLITVSITASPQEPGEQIITVLLKQRAHQLR